MPLCETNIAWYVSGATLGCQTQRHQWWIAGGVRDDRPLLAQFLSFSCSFRQNYCHIIIGWHNRFLGLVPSLENPGSTTGHVILKIFTKWSFNFHPKKFKKSIENFKWEMDMSHFAYACKMRYPLNLVLESWEYLWFYWTFCIVILDYGLKLHKLSNHTLVMLQKWLEIH